jgi:hypothetical protein
MKVLIFTQHFPPETVGTGLIALDMAESLAGRGHMVTVITGVPNHPSSLGRPFCQDAPPEERAPAGYSILRVPVFRSMDPRALKRVLTYATFMLSAAWRGAQQPRPDAILAVSPLPTGLAALLAHWWHRAPLLFNLQDIWPDSALAIGVMKRGRLLWALQRLEVFFYRRCARVVGITEGFKRYLVDLGLEPERVAVIHNGVDWEKFARALPNEELRRREQLAGKFVVGYIGNIGLAQRLDTVLEAAQELCHEPVSFLALGEGVDKPRLMALAQARGLENVRFLEGVPREQVPSVLAACDALLVILRDDPLFNITIPSKIYEYMAAGKPILCSVGGEAAALVVEASCGLPVPPSDGRALAASVRRLLADRSLCRAMGEAGAARARARFARAVLMGAYAELLEDFSRKRERVTREAGTPLLEEVDFREP